MGRTLLRLTLAAMLAALVPSVACSRSPSSANGDDEDTIGSGGVGYGCSPGSGCRAGLACVGGICQLGHATEQGQSCMVSGECKEGLYCSLTRTCDKAGSNEAGANCTTDAECKSGLKCDLVGLSAVCQAEGKVDAGGPCASQADCMGGLTCAGGHCMQPQTGQTSGGGSIWQGASCSDDPGASPEAYFKVPRAAPQGDFYQLPFPNDIRMKNGHPDLSGHPTPGSDLLGFDLVDRYLRAIERDTDGFSAYPSVLFRFSRAIDVDSFRANGVVRFFDVTPGDPQVGAGIPLGWYAYGGRGAYVCSNWLGVRPGAGYALEPGHTYAVVLTTGGKAPGGGSFTRGEDLSALLVDAPPADAGLTAAHAAYAPLRAALPQAKLAADDILNAAVFTVGHVRAPMEKVAKGVAAAKAPAASGWVRCGDGPSPCPDATGPRACGGADPAFDELHALVELPVFQRGKAPYLTPDDGGDVDLSADAAPVQRTEQVCMALTVPKGTMPAKGWPLVVYAHGTGGSFRSHVGEGVAAALAGAETPMAVLGIDQVEHGPRRGGSTMSPNELFFNAQNPLAARGNPLQGAADQLSLARLASSLSLPQSPTGGPLAIDPGAVMFWGHSQGATEGALALPYAPGVSGAVLSGEGASLIDSLLHKTSPVNIAKLLPSVLFDPNPSQPGELLGGPYHPVLAFLQMYIDPADPLNHGALIASRPLAGSSGKHLFQPYGQADSFSPIETQAAFALASGLDQAAPDASVSKADDVGGLMPLPVPLSGNRGTAEKKLTAAFRQYHPDASYDGHFVAFKHPTAKADVVRFLAETAQGMTPEVGAK